MGPNMHNTVILETNGRLICFGFKGFTGLYSRTLTWLANLLKVCPRGFGLENLLFVLFTKVNLKKAWECVFQGSSLLYSLQILSASSPTPSLLLVITVSSGENFRKSGLNLAFPQGSPPLIVPVQEIANVQS